MIGNQSNKIVYTVESKKIPVNNKRDTTCQN